MLKKSCPYHRGPTKHTLEECTVLRRYYTDIIAKEGAEEPPRAMTLRGKASPRSRTAS